MPQLAYITRGNASPQGKPRVYFCCHPADQAAFLQPMAKELLALVDCSVWYDPEPATPLSPEERSSREADLIQMQLFVLPVTTRLLNGPSRAMEWEFPLAREQRIPVLPILQEPGLETLFNQKCGDLQGLNPNQTDPTARPYAEKLKKFLESVLIGDELATQVRAAFDAYIFLSYRKKDRREAQALMRLIHEIPEGVMAEIVVHHLVKPLPQGQRPAPVRTGTGRRALFQTRHGTEAQLRHLENFRCGVILGLSGEPIAAALAPNTGHQALLGQKPHNRLQIFLRNLLPLGNLTKGHIAVAVLLRQINHHAEGIATTG